MEFTKEGILLIVHGIKDCFIGVLSLKVFLRAQGELNPANEADNEGNVRSKLFQCVAFGLFFWASNWVFNNLFLLCIIWLAEWTGEDINSNEVDWLQRILYGLFCGLWIFPLLIISKFLNFGWYQEIANLVLVRSGVRKQEDFKTSDFCADLVKSLILQMFYCFQGLAIYLVPGLPMWVKTLWYLVHFALLSSLYAFEYKWVYIGWPLHRRLQIIDKKWPYYVGFGLPLAVVTIYVSSFIDNMIIFATLFPIYVISSSVIYDSQSPVFRFPLYSFTLADKVSDVFIGLVMKLVHFALGSV